jgi:hypothetical protein
MSMMRCIQTSIQIKVPFAVFVNLIAFILWSYSFRHVLLVTFLGAGMSCLLMIALHPPITVHQFDDDNNLPIRAFGHASSP